MANYDATGSGAGTALTAGQQAERKMSADDQAALKAAGDKWVAANAAGDEAAKKAAHDEAEAIRANYGYSGGANGAGYVELPAKTQEPIVGSPRPTDTGTQGTQAKQSYMIRNGQNIQTQFMNGHNYNADGSAIDWQPGDISVTPNGQYWIIGDDGQARQLDLTTSSDASALLKSMGLGSATPEYLESPQGQLMLANIGKYPDFVRYIITEAPNSTLAYHLEAMFPEYTVGEGVEKMTGLGYEAQYMPKYWEDFTNTYDPEKYASDYDNIRDQLIAANQAGVDLGRMQLEAQLENALPQYDELRAQNDLAKAKAANNVALYNQAQGDLGGIGSRRYSLEQNAYDQRMNEIQLEQQNLINTTNQQIAQLEAQGKMQEAQLLAEWGQAKLDAMQEQYNLYWNMYQQGASAMENLAYDIASDEWNRNYQLNRDELEDQYRKWQAEVAAYDAAVDKAKTELGVDEYNTNYLYNKWKDITDYNVRQADAENNYNANARADAVQQQKLQLDVDESNRDFDWNKWLTEWEHNYQIGRDAISDARYEQEWEEQLKEVAFDNAFKKLQVGMLSDSDVEALGVPKKQAQTIADRINLLAQIDTESAQQQLELLKKQVATYGLSGGSGGGGGGGRRSSGGGGGGGDDSDIFAKLLAAGVKPGSRELWDALYDAGYTSQWQMDAQKQLYEDYYNTTLSDLGYNPKTGNYIYDGDAKGTIGTALDMLGKGGTTGDTGEPSLETLLWGLNHDKTMQNILDNKGVPYADEKKPIVGTNPALLFSEQNYRGKR